MSAGCASSLDRILIASGNVKKLRELEAMLGPLGIEVVTPDAVGGLDEVDEDQPTFAGNAAKKARAAARKTGMVALADDSGLEVAALDGAPGVRSARFAGEPCDDERNNDALLERLAALGEVDRRARFVCALALATPEGELLFEGEGTSEGEILHERRGDRDFGYDPLFLFTEPGSPVTGKSFAELGPEEKASVSHRGRAVRRLADFLRDAREERG